MKKILLALGVVCALALTTGVASADHFGGYSRGPTCGTRSGGGYGYGYSGYGRSPYGNFSRGGYGWNGGYGGCGGSPYRSYGYHNHNHGGGLQVYGRNFGFGLRF
ncbi:MAG: hypothetical protein KDA41_19575 [Planctomycetales bacterium]|nr:hypothetical protein [Planctomycetales bacterium]